MSYLLLCLTDCIERNKKLGRAEYQNSRLRVIIFDNSGYEEKVQRNRSSFEKVLEKPFKNQNLT